MNIEDVIKEYGSYLYHYALKLSCNPTDAQDLTQETFIKAWKNMQLLRDEGAIKSWLTSICYREFLLSV
ncbi:MAG: RNA polymerase sigma factor [Clostridiales bacterium]|nr:RNA polymerase sigma factor [Clostridiales bacterium]